MQELTNFINALKHSQLIETDVLKTAVRQFQSEMKSAGKLTADLTTGQLCEFLVKNSLVTSWQAEKLVAGKFRGFFLGKYKLLGVLGAGGMSVVYLAENRLLGQRRAIKVLPKSKMTDSSFLERFYLEARAAAALDHPNIVKTFDIDNQDEQHYMVMEFVEGQDLSLTVQQQRRLPFKTATDFLMQAAKALQHAHQAGLIHRDVKPSNFLVTDDEQVKLMDLGLAKFTESSASLTLMHNETMLGTADYLSPEQAINSHQVDRRTDIYSLGGTLYFMIAGHPPFPEGSIAQRLVHHQSVKPPTLKSLRQECPDFLSDLCDWLMEKAPENRCQDCGQLVDQLQRWTEDPTLTFGGKSPSLDPIVVSVAKEKKNVTSAAVGGENPQPTPPPPSVPSVAKNAGASPKSNASNINAPNTATASPKLSGSPKIVVPSASLIPIAKSETALTSQPGPDLKSSQVGPNFAINTQPKVKVASVSVATGASTRAKPKTGNQSASPSPRKKLNVAWILGGLAVLLGITVVFLVWVFMQGS